MPRGDGEDQNGRCGVEGIERLAGEAEHTQRPHYR